ncbi:hypothetical protein AB0E04_02535 [Streptomyces sp. NPDC048251]|uniref:hypothetical protein n=1 Tax=Streptomyces sp. NPDC048251 TaxID=3154501 RepID=UPI00341E01AF
MAQRDLKQLDTDLQTAENSITAIKNELGAVPSGNTRTILFRIGELEKLSATVTRIETNVVATDAAITQLKEKFKEFRWMVLGLAVSLQLFKLDIQAFKLDITLFKEWKKNDVIAGAKASPTYLKALFSKQARDALAAEKQRKKDEKKLKSDLEKALKGIPGRVDRIEQSIKPSTLRSHFDTVYFQKSKAQPIYQGIRAARTEADKANQAIDVLRNKLKAAGNAGSPNAKPPKNAKKDVTDLRASVKDLSEALAGI